MGLRLDMHIEVKTEGRWEHYTLQQRPHMGRLLNSILFAAINHTMVDSIPEGVLICPACRTSKFPGDMTPVTKRCFEHAGRNETKVSCGTLEAGDIENLADTVRKINGTDFNELAGITGAKDYGFEDIRILFWFIQY